MYACSDAFHLAVAQNAPQMALFFFEDGIITNEDIDMEEGVEFKEYFCTTEDIGIGEALSNELNFKVYNIKQLLNDFPFGEFTALLGVRIKQEDANGELVLSYEGHDYQGGATAGRRLLKDDKPTTGQPPFIVASMAAKDGVVYCYSDDGIPYAVSADTGEHVTCPDNGFMRDKMSRRAGFTYSYENRILTVVNSINFVQETYEFVPLGIFEAERPKVVDDAELSLECLDRMSKFDDDLDIEITYPITAKALLQLVADAVDVPLEVDSFINDGATLDNKPEEFDNCTMRNVVAWIAEIAASNAKITRDGKLNFVWLNSTSQSYAESDYTECRPYYYQTKKVDKLCSRNLSESTDTTFGVGDNTYLIQDNPFLK